MPSLFRTGIHPPDKKSHSEKQIIEELPLPDKVYIPLSQHIGKPARPVVFVGNSVKAGEIIGKADGLISADVFASVSGTVTEILPMVTPNGRCEHIVITRDPAVESSDSVLLEPLSETAEPAAIVERVREAGIVGMGGAGFPTAVKLSPTEPIDTFIINAAECEPYITCDYRVMMDYTEQFLRGCLLLKRAVGAKKLIIGIEDNKKDAVGRIKGEISRQKFSLETMLLPTRYPQGAEKQLVYSVTRRKIVPGKLPASVGVVVCNVHTALSVYLAVTKGQPLYRRILTVSGNGIRKPMNVWVPTGTSYADIAAYAGGYDEEQTVKLLAGGPMMGTAVDNLEYTTSKTTNGLLFLTRDEAFTRNPMPCIKCGKCVRVCPMKLMPVYIDAYALIGDITSAVRYGSRECIECGCCTYTCPAKRPLVQSIRLAKKKDAEKNAKRREKDGK